MPMLRATKALKYKTRRLMAGDEFEASSRDARILLGIRKAEQVEEEEQAPKLEEEPEGASAQLSQPSRSEIYRMRKEELITFLSDAGKKVDEGASVPDLRNQALALL